MLRKRIDVSIFFTFVSSLVRVQLSWGKSFLSTTILPAPKHQQIKASEDSKAEAHIRECPHISFPYPRLLPCRTSLQCLFTTSKNQATAWLNCDVIGLAVIFPESTLRCRSSLLHSLQLAIMPPMENSRVPSLKVSSSATIPYAS